MILSLMLASALAAQTAKDMDAGWPSCPTANGRAVYSVLVFGVNDEGVVTSTAGLQGDPGFLEEAAAAAKKITLPRAIANSYYGLFCTTDASSRLGYIFDQSVFRGEKPPARVAPSFAAANLEKRVEPRYPALAKSRFVQGPVTLDIVINGMGEVAAVTPLRGAPELYHSAVDGVRQWKYKPFSIGEKPIAVETTVTLNYAVNR